MFSLQYASPPPHANRSTPPAPNYLFLCKSFAINCSLYFLNILSFPSACRITILTKAFKLNRLIQILQGFSCYRQRILNKSHEKTSYFEVPQFKNKISMNKFVNNCRIDLVTLGDRQGKSLHSVGTRFIPRGT